MKRLLMLLIVGLAVLVAVGTDALGKGSSRSSGASAPSRSGGTASNSSRSSGSRAPSNVSRQAPSRTSAPATRSPGPARTPAARQPNVTRSQPPSQTRRPSGATRPQASPQTRRPTGTTPPKSPPSMRPNNAGNRTPPKAVPNKAGNGGTQRPHANGQPTHKPNTVNRPAPNNRPGKVTAPKTSRPVPVQKPKQPQVAQKAKPAPKAADKGKAGAQAKQSEQKRSDTKSAPQLPKRENGRGMLADETDNAGPASSAPTGSPSGSGDSGAPADAGGGGAGIAAPSASGSDSDDADADSTDSSAMLDGSTGGGGSGGGGAPGTEVDDDRPDLGPSVPNPVDESDGTLNPRNPDVGQGDGRFWSPRDGDRRHQGIDITAPEGTQIYPVAPGKVVFSGVSSDPNKARAEGYKVIVQSPDGTRSVYMHLQPRDLPDLYSQVTRSSVIGRVGRTGNVPPGAQSHLHLQMYDKYGNLVEPNVQPVTDH